MIRSPIALAFFRTVLLFFALFVLTSGTAWEVRAQPNAFLLTPYYGTHVITNNYSGGHPAYDFDMSHEQVLAAEAGTIERVRWYDNRPECHGPVDNAACGYGFHIYIRHANNYTTRYGHLNATAFDLDNLSYGAPVQRGQIIGMSGNTGWATGATGLHLHFEVKDANGGSVDPFNPNLWMDGQWAGRPIPAPINGGETFTYVSTNNSGGFSKGENNGVTPPPFNNTCTGDCANWTAATSTYGSMYSTLVNGSVPDSWAKWQAAVSPNGGMYEVFVYVPSNNATSWQAPYTIRYFNNVAQTTALVDQYGLENRWVSLGTYYMTSNDYVFTTDATGEGLGVHCGSGQYCKLGADAVKFVRRGTNYLPHLIGSSNWKSKIAVRNNGGGVAFVSSLFFDAAGNLQCMGYTSIAANDFETFDIDATHCPQAVSASIDTSQDTALIVEEDQTASGTDGYNGIASVDPLNASWGQTGTTLFAPVIMNNYYGWTSEIVLFNAGPNTASGTITYYGGAYPQGITYSFSNLAPNKTYRTSFGGATNVLYSARIAASQPVAAIVRQYSGSVNEAYNALSTGSATNYAPLIMNNYYGWDTSVTVQNTTGTTAIVTVRYYDGSGNQIGPAHPASIPGYNSGLFYSPNQGLPTGFIGTARISSDRPVVAVVTQSSPHGGSSIQGMSYAGSAGGSNWVMLPELRNYTGSGNWVSSVNVQNLSASSNSVILNYGGQSWSATLAPNGFKSFYIPSYFGTTVYRGPATVSANFPIAVVVNHSSATISNLDTAYTYDGLIR